jgi:polysaccharide biosynthesis protein PslH
VVVPITEGAGSPIKFIEALAYGVPVVATPTAARGLDVAPGVHYSEGYNAATLAEAIMQVVRDGGAEMAVEGRRLAEREYSIESLAERIAA